MNANDAHFLPFLGTANAQFVIPVYQRLYSWGRKDCEVLWNDIVRAGKYRRTHFVGSMLYAPEAGGTLTGINRYLLIDGQQRMTTLTLILAAFVQYLSEDESRASFLDMTVGGLRRLYLFDNDRKGESRYKLVLSQDDKETLFSIVGDAATPVNQSMLIADNFEFFAEKMREPSFDPELLWVGLGKLVIVDTKLGADDNAQLIFESMNSKGKPLSATDLIRNYILMSLPNDEQTRLYESYWHPMEQMFGRGNDHTINEFFWNWLWLKVPNRKPRMDEVYDEFKLYLGDNPETRSEALLGDLLTSADHYTRIFCGRENDGELSKAFWSFNRLGINAARLLLMELYAQYDAGNLTKDEFIYLVKILESFLFRRAICTRLTTGLNHYFAGLAKQLDSVEIVDYIIGNLLAQDARKTAYFPTDEYFEEQFVTRDCYKRFRDKCSYFLEAIENYHHPKEPISAGSYQIEHVLPQKISDSPEWQAALGDDWEQLHDQLCDSLGNLTLTGYNQEYSNKPFEFKRDKPDDGFACSPLFLNRFIAGETEWNADSIARRAVVLMRDAKKIWPYPFMEEAVIARYRPQKASDGTKWTIEEHHGWMAEGGPCYQLYTSLSGRIAETFPEWEVDVTKYYVGFKSGSKLMVSIQDRKSGKLVLGLRKGVESFDDPKGLCIDKRPNGGIGPGMSTMIVLEDAGGIDDVLGLLAQA